MFVVIGHEIQEMSQYQQYQNAEYFHYFDLTLYRNEN